MVWTFADLRCTISTVLHRFPAKNGKFPRLDTAALSERDVADLNLPPEFASRLRARKEAADLRRYR